MSSKSSPVGIGAGILGMNDILWILTDCVRCSRDGNVVCQSVGRP